MQYHSMQLIVVLNIKPNVKGPTGYQIDNQYLEDEVKEVEGYIDSIKAK